MRLFLFMWIMPITLLGVWYGLASNDMHFGIHTFSRATHDEVFAVYSAILGIDAELLPGLVLRAIIVDTFIVAGIVAFRMRHRWWPQTRARITAWWEQRRAPAAAGRAQPAE